MFKRLFDLTFSASLLLLLSPLYLCISLAILLSSGMPIIFTQSRIGHNLKSFTIYKFRTMNPNSEKLGTGLFSYSNDPRITPLGKFLRKYSLDEIPQLFNILIGDMSFVGPRPPVTYELGEINLFPDNLRFRFTVRPGVTGLAQVYGRNHNNWDDKVRLDNKYIFLFKRYGIILDLSLLVMTAWTVCFANNTIEDLKNSSSDGPISTLAKRASIHS